MVVTNNYFSSIGLFIELANVETYATSTIRANQVGLPFQLKNLRSFTPVDQGMECNVEPVNTFSS